MNECNNKIAGLDDDAYFKNMFAYEDKCFYFKGFSKLLQNYGKRGGIILDAGCGTGRFLKELSGMGTTFGTDIGRDALKYAKLRGNNLLTNSSLLNLPYKNESFDMVVCIGVLYHMRIKNDIRALEEIYRVLKKDGVAIITVAAYEFMRSSFDDVECTRHRYTKGEIKEKCEKLFSVEKCAYLHFLVFPLAVMQRFIMKFKKTNIPSHIPRIPFFLNYLLGNFCSIEPYLIKFIPSFPFGLTIFCRARKIK